MIRAAANDKDRDITYLSISIPELFLQQPHFHFHDIVMPVRRLNTFLRKETLLQLFCAQ